MNVVKKKCLFILTRLPYPPVGGDKLKSYNLVKILAELYDLSIIIVTDEKVDGETKQFLKEYSVEYKIFTFPKWRFYLNSFRIFFSGNPIQVDYYYFSKVQKYCNAKIVENEILIANLIRAAKYFQTDIAVSKVRLLDMVDSISMNYERSINNVSSFFWKLIYTFEAKRLKSFEESCVRSFSATFFVNDKEREYWSSYGNTFHIPNGVNEKLFSYSKIKKITKNYITFFGKMNYQPNIDAVMWYMNNVHDFVDEKIYLVIIGAFPSRKIKKLGLKKNVVVTDFIGDPYEIINGSSIVIAPMQTGGGIQNKVLETMALGKINLLSSLAAQPISSALNGEHFLIEDDPLIFSEKINEICLSKHQKNQISENAKRFVLENYSWENYKVKFVEMINAINKNK
jgi:glycosyltransferase involved in cell wall biosynthesis